jgi:maltodextrin utilization protein YvdJ
LANVVDMMTAEQLIERYNQSAKAVSDINTEIENLPKQLEARMKYLKEQLVFADEERSKFGALLGKAQVTAKIHSEQAKREPKKD